MQTGLIIFLGLLALYVVFVFWLVQTKRLEKWNLSLLLGIILMIRTQRGTRTIDFIARPKRLWNAIGDFGIFLTLTGMVLITLVLLWTVWLVMQPDSEFPALGATEILVIPGVTPFVPLVYGLIGLIVTLVVHEGGHGVLARANGMKLKSIGLLVAIVPIGAFVEPDDLDIKVASRRQRLRVYGAGPAVNFGFAAIALAAFALMMGSLAPIPGVHVAALSEGGPAQDAGVQVGQTIVDVRTDEGAWQRIADWDSLLRFINTTSPGDTVHFFFFDGTERKIALESQWSAIPVKTQESISSNQTEGLAFCEARLQPAPKTGAECFARFSGASRMGISPFQDASFAPLANPLGRNGINMLVMFSLPLAEIRGGASFLNVYIPAFYAEPFAPDIFWVAANILFWIFWINLAVGITNILPMLPLDGGHIFRDAAGGVYQKLRPGLATERRERLVNLTVGAVSLTMLAAFIIQIGWPHLMNALR